MEDWRTLEAWHTLFDVLCVQRGWYDNTYLASELCAFAGKGTQQDFEAAKKKLRSWRSGRRLPLRRNLALIGELLGIAGDADLEQRWYLLYRRAQALQKATSNPVGTNVGADTPALPSREASVARGAASSLAVVLLCLAVAAGAWSTGRQTIGSGLPAVDFVGHVRLPLDSSRIIHGSSGGCEGPLPTWQEINDTLPKTSLGTFTDGGLARKVVRRCGRELPVRAVLFTGLRTGIEEVVVLEDFIKIEVVETH